MFFVCHALCLFFAAVWSPGGIWLISWLLFVMLIVILLLSHLASWNRCGTYLYRFLILADFLTSWEQDVYSKSSVAQIFISTNLRMHCRCPKEPSQHMILLRNIKNLNYKPLSEGLGNGYWYILDSKRNAYFQYPFKTRNPN